MKFIKKHRRFVMQLCVGLYLIIFSFFVTDSAFTKAIFRENIIHITNDSTGSNETQDSSSYVTYLPIVSKPEEKQILAFLYFGDYWRGDLWTVAEDGTNLKPLTNNGNITSYSWSSDGEKIAFIITHDDVSGGIYTINADGSDMRKLTAKIPMSTKAIDWHDSKIAFLRQDGDMPNMRISYVDLSAPTHPIVDISPILINLGTGLNPIYGSSLRWSPNGQWIVLKHGTAYGIASSDGNVFINENLPNPRWKNDSSYIISPARNPDNGIYFFNPNNYLSGFISHVPNHVAVYSPDDQYVVYCDDYALTRIKPDNTQHTILAYVKAAHPAWAPESDKIAFVSWEEEDYFPSLTGLHIINSDGSNPIAVISGWVKNPKWQP